MAGGRIPTSLGPYPKGDGQGSQGTRRRLDRIGRPAAPRLALPDLRRRSHGGACDPPGDRTGGPLFTTHRIYARWALWSAPSADITENRGPTREVPGLDPRTQSVSTGVWKEDGGGELFEGGAGAGGGLAV